MTKLKELQERYHGLNKLGLGRRNAASNMIENWVRETMNARAVISHQGERVRDWAKCGLKDDKNYKRDAYYERDGDRYYAQLKFRSPDSGNDILSAIIQPYHSLAMLKTIVRDEPEKLKDHVWGRDYKFNGHWYCSLSRDWERLRILDYRKIVKPRINGLLAEWYRSGEELNTRNRAFRSSTYNGFMLRWTFDKGVNSWDSGEKKIVCFMPRSMFENNEITVIDMIDPPDYLFS